MGLQFRRLGLMGEPKLADDSEGERQRHYTEHLILHGDSPLLKPALEADDRRCHLAFSDRLEPLAKRKKPIRAYPVDGRTRWLILLKSLPNGSVCRCLDLPA